MLGFEGDRQVSGVNGLMGEMSENWFKPTNSVLLTGAGFTKNFGGYLANEMWAAIFNQSETAVTPILRDTLLRNLNFEDVYDDLLSDSSLSAEERQRVINAVTNAYAEMDALLLDAVKGNSKASQAFQTFLKYFKGDKGTRTKGFFFTLNQDLLVERFWPQDTRLEFPGVALSFDKGRKLEPRDRIELRDQQEIDDIKQHFWTKNSPAFVYIKLHGSYSWKGRGGTQMVLGRRKTGTIANEPLLKWYFELFEEVTSVAENLVVIGYGFRDDHINQVISNGVVEHSLKLHVISPLEPAKFKESLVGERDPAPFGSKLWEGLAHYECARVTEMFVPGSVQLPFRTRRLFQKLQIPGFAAG